MNLVPNSIDALLRELEAFGKANDAHESDRARRMLNITRDTGEFLLWLVCATRARHILEIGASNGYSTIWLGLAARANGGRVVSLDVLQSKLDLARENIDAAGLGDVVALRLLDGGAFLREVEAGSLDFVFLDSNRAHYVGWWANVQRALRIGGVVVVDNATSHAHEMAEFDALVRGTDGYAVSLATVGNGELLIFKQR